MAAFKFITENSLKIASNFNTHEGLTVLVYQKNGTTSELPWVGFMGYSGQSPDDVGKFGKISAISVTPDNGGDCSSWSTLLPGQFLLGWITVRKGTLCVLAMLNTKGCPMVMGSPDLISYG